MPGIRLNPAAVQTNIVIFDVSGLGIPAATVSQELKSRGVLANGINSTHMRMVTHRDVNRRDCEVALEAMEQVAWQATPMAVTR